MAKKNRRQKSAQHAAVNRKGASFERKTCERLSLWVSGGKRRDIYWRSSMSGGRATRRGPGQFSKQAGDISAIDPLGELLLSKFVIECKHKRDLVVHRTILGGRLNTGLFAIFEEEWKKARKLGREPMVVAKQNNQPVVAVTTTSGLDWLLAANDGFGVEPHCYIPSLDAYVLPFREVTCIPFEDLRAEHEVLGN